MSRDLFRDEDGFTTTSMVLSLLITLSLVFTAAQVYRVNSASAQVQDVADAAALAAENQVAEFMVVCRFCDAVVLSLSLTGLAATGLGLAALCTPATFTLSEGLLAAGRDIVRARNAFAERAAGALGKMQEALPFFAAAAAAGVSAANDSASSGSRYLGVAVLVPAKGKALAIASDDRSSQLLEDIGEQADDIREKARRAEEAAQQANRAKERAFARDCGDAPGYCMYERAGRLAGLSGSSNPLFTSVDAWSFSVALERARAYYRARLRIEAPASGSVDEQARSALRSHFYTFAVEELKAGYVRETADSFEANFPHLPSNTAEMRLTSLYTDRVYPITEADDVQVMHAWMGCPAVAGREVVGMGSIAQMEELHLGTCPACEFTASSLGKVAAASTSIQNGFEYHYEAVADEAFLYETARRDADVPKREVESQVGGLFEQLLEVARDTVGKRIEPSPPGRYGAIALVVNAGSTSVAGGFASRFVADAAALGPRAAASASTLVDEGSAEGRTVLNSLLDGIRMNGGVVTGVAGVVLDVWSWMIVAYGNGQEAVTGGVGRALDALPLSGASGLGSWASDKLRAIMDGVGLQPAEVGALKPLLVNSAHVAAKGEDSFSAGYLAVKRQVVAHPLMSADLFSSVLDDAQRTAIGWAGGLGDTIEIASIELLGTGGPTVPIEVPIPAEARTWGIAAIQSLFDRVRGFRAQLGEVRVWE